MNPDLAFFTYVSRERLKVYPKQKLGVEICLFAPQGCENNYNYLKDFLKIKTKLFCLIL